MIKRQPSILVVDDDRFLLDNLIKLLNGEEYSATGVSTGEEALNYIGTTDTDLVILDLGLPGIDGITTCRRIRKSWNGPILMLTARSDSSDKVMGLEVGADDYLVKPFDVNELKARVRAQLRRKLEYSHPVHESNTVVLDDWVIDFNLRDTLVNGKPAELTSKEFELVAYLAQNLNRAISRDQVFEHVWGYDSDFNTNSLDVYIYRIRKKLEDDPNQPKHLLTMRGYGYKLV